MTAQWRRRLALGRGGAYAFAALTLGAGCRSSGFETTSELPDVPRRAPGVASDPPSGFPEQRANGQTAERVLVLRTPLAGELSRKVIAAFLESVVHEDQAAVAALLAPDAALQVGAQGSRQNARGFWQTRFLRLDYTALSGQTLLREDALETYDSESAAKLADTRPLPLPISGEELLVRAPLAHTHTGKSRLFGDEIVFVLRPTGSTYQISLMLEDFTLP